MLVALRHAYSHYSAPLLEDQARRERQRTLKQTRAKLHDRIRLIFRSRPDRFLLNLESLSWLDNAWPRNYRCSSYEMSCSNSGVTGQKTVPMLCAHCDAERCKGWPSPLICTVCRQGWRQGYALWGAQGLHNSIDSIDPISRRPRMQGAALGSCRRAGTPSWDASCSMTLSIWDRVPANGDATLASTTYVRACAICRHTRRLKPRTYCTWPILLPVRKSSAVAPPFPPRLYQPSLQE